jgi:acyl-CoA reductase-like NAD-dependent aldehyde dehydrogenase
MAKTGVLANAQAGSAAEPAPARRVFGDIESAVRAARKAFEDLMGCTLETRRRMIAAMRETGLAHLEEIARLAVEETGMGGPRTRAQEPHRHHGHRAWRTWCR